MKEADFDSITYWHKFIETNDETVDALIDLGIGNLLKKQARKHFTKAEKLIPDFTKYTAIPVVDHPPNSKTFKYKSYSSPF